MTRSDATTSAPPDHRTDRARGLRVDRIPGRHVHTTNDGQHIAVPLWVLRNGRHSGDTDLVLSRQEAEQLLTELAGELAKQAPR